MRKNIGTDLLSFVPTKEGLLQEDKVFQIEIRGTLNHSGDLQASLDLGYRLITTLVNFFNRGFEDVLKEIRKRDWYHPCFLTFDIDFC